MSSSPEFTANVELPLLVTDADSVRWDDEADVVIVGFGGAGVVAALQAREEGAAVLAVDRFVGGGATAMSGGVVYAGGTQFQRDAGFDDSADEMYKYLSFEGVPVRPETLRRFCESSNGDIEWLMKYGVKFGSTFYAERIAYPPDGYHLYYTGMEKFRDIAKPIPRGHRTLGKGPTGRNYFVPLRDAALRSGVRFVPHAPARRLVVDEGRRVVGIEIQVIPEGRRSRHEAIFRKVNPYKMLNGAPAERAIDECREFEQSLPPDRRFLRARCGVILAAGGYNYNLRLFGRYRPIVLKAYPELVRGGTMGCDGSGIELGTSVGGALSHMDRLFVTKPLSPPSSFVNGVLVNAEGRRFIAEDAYLGNVGCAVAEQSHEGIAWLILDRLTFRAGLRELMWPPGNIVSWYGLPAILNILFGGTRRAKTLGELAGKLGIDPEALQRTVRSYNASTEAGHDAEMGKLRIHLRSMGTGPYVALNMSLRNRWGFSGTMPYGGLTVDEDTGLVTRADGSTIEGLYAAGRTAVGICSESNFSGLSIADTVFSGRRAARAATRSVRAARMTRRPADAA
jgi:3-oxo-5alpha-steroid 4-dehydrogenase